MVRALVAGIFVGGASSRMGRPKGLLEIGGVTLIDRWLGLLKELEVPAVLIGRRAEYSALACEVLGDASVDCGPLAGLVSLLAHAGGGDALALACDMPYVDRNDLEALIASDGAIAAPRRQEHWEPLCARYQAPLVLPIARRRLDERELGLQALLDEVGATAIDLPEAHLRDWDSPADVD